MTQARIVKPMQWHLATNNNIVLACSDEPTEDSKHRRHTLTINSVKTY